jgi:hypothetical protein
MKMAEWMNDAAEMPHVREADGGPNGVTQCLREGEELPSLDQQVTAHFANKTHNRGDSAAFLRDRERVGIRSTLSALQKQNLTRALLGTTIYKALAGEAPAKNRALFQDIVIGQTAGHDIGVPATITAEDVEKYIKKEYLPPQVYGYLERQHRQLGEQRPSGVSRWQNGQTLIQTSRLAEDEEEQGGYLAMGDNGGNEYEANLRKAQEIISTIVQPQVLATVPAPRVIVHRHLPGAPGFRAYQGGAEVHIASEDPPETIVHEVGHYLESNLASDLHFDAATLREKRHTEAIGLSLIGRRAAGAIADEEGETERDRKGRYKGTYGATGAYTSKIYEGIGATEVVSTSMEFMATPAKAKDLVEKDPQQALLVLRRLRPSDAQIAAIARDYQDFLPN